MTKIKCATCGLEVMSIDGGRALRYPDGAEIACIGTDKHRPIECDAMHRAILAAERRRSTTGK